MYLIRCVYGLCVHNTHIFTRHFVTEQNFDLESTRVLCQQVVLAWKLLASFPLFSKVVLLPVVCPIYISIGKKSSAYPVFSMLSMAIVER